MRDLYIEPFCGLSGDMLLSALCDLADYFDQISELPKQLNLTDGEVKVDIVNKNGIVCKHVRIIDLNQSPNHDHGKKHHHHHHHRHLQDILSLIDAGDIGPKAKEIAKEIFMIIGKSEAKVHNMDLDKIHFHEVSAVDSILDIVGCAVLIDKLEIRTTFCDPICTGFGMVQTQHGLLPIPAPATADILMEMPTYPGREEGEKVTPTGAAILRYLQPIFSIEEIRRDRIAYGPGKKDFISPNVVRLSLLGEKKKTSPEQGLIMVETNLDDCPPEWLGQNFQEDLFTKGAIDFFLTPVQMKKGRPGLKLSVLVDETDLDKICEHLLEHTTSIGVRYYAVKRQILKRKNIELDTPYGKVSVKEVIAPSGEKKYKIEHKSLRILQLKHGMTMVKLVRELQPFINDLPK